MPLITYDMLKLYQQYDGDTDWLARAGKASDIALFTDNETSWYKTGSAMQDMDLISKRLASKEYTEKVITGLKAACDEPAFTALTSSIPFFSDFQKIANILSIIKSKIFDTDIVYTRFDRIGELENLVDNCIKSLFLCDFETLSIVQIDFGPTSTYQELSMRNGWADEYLKIAEAFDSLYAAIYANIPPPDFKATKPRSGVPNIFIMLWSRVFAKHS